MAKFLYIAPQNKKLDDCEKTGKEEKTDDTAVCCTEHEQGPKKHHVDLLRHRKDSKRACRYYLQHDSLIGYILLLKLFMYFTSLQSTEQCTEYKIRSAWFLV